MSDIQTTWKHFAGAFTTDRKLFSDMTVLLFDQLYQSISRDLQANQGKFTTTSEETDDSQDDQAS